MRSILLNRKTFPRCFLTDVSSGSAGLDQSVCPHPCYKEKDFLVLTSSVRGKLMLARPEGGKGWWVGSQQHASLCTSNNGGLDHS